MKRSKEDWELICEGITAGPVAGGDKAGVYTSSQKLLNTLHPKHLWEKGSHVLDIGCGNGRLAMALCEEGVTYTGLEIIPECVDFCNNAFSDYPSFTFRHIDVKNERYNKGGTTEPHNVVYPIDDDSIDFVAMLSVMTHIDEKSVKRNLEEVNRVLADGGLFLSTWFKSPPNDVTDDPARTVFHDYDISKWLEKHFDILSTDGGSTNSLHDQWFIVCAKVQ